MSTVHALFIFICSSRYPSVAQGLAFMFECNAMLKVADWALGAEDLDGDYAACWRKLPKLFAK